MCTFINDLLFNLLAVRQHFDTAGCARFTIVQANAGVAELTGFPANELAGKSLVEMLSTNSFSSWQAVFAHPDSIQTEVSLRAEIVCKDGQTRPALLSISTLPAKTATYQDYLILLQDRHLNNDIAMMSRVVEQSASAMMITDSKGHIEYVNPMFNELTGYATEELMGKTPRILKSGDTPPDYYKAMWEALHAQGMWQGEIKNRRKDGQSYWVHESISAIRNSDGNITHFLAVEEDVTHRMRVESALSESEERFRQMAELSGEWLWEQDPKGYYLYSSIAVAQILGFDQKEIIGKHYTELLTTQDKASQTSVSGSQAAFYALVNHYRHKDGHLVLTESTGLPIFDAQGKLLKWRGVDRDITARMQYQNALIESEKRTRLIIESSMNAIVIMDAFGLITDWNQQAERMFGWSADEAIGQRLEKLIIPVRFQSAHVRGMEHYLKTGEGPILNRLTEQIAVRRDGTEFPIELSVSPLKLGSSYIFSGFIHDISSRKAAERQIRQAQVNLAIAQNEIRIAQEIQDSLSPSAPVISNEFSIMGRCLPADKVGGDYYDYFFRNEALLDIVIADVSGHSIGPALFMVETRSAIRALTNLPITPSETLSVLNNFLFDDLNRSDYFISLFYAQIDVAKHQLRYANAGHPTPLIFNTKTSKYQELDADGLLVGIQQDIVFEQKIHPLAEGDVVLFYTDGLIEAEDPDHIFFGLERAKATFCQHAELAPHAIIDALMAELRRFCQKSSFKDDITLMVCKWR